MSDLDAVNREHVLLSLKEHDERGPADFRSRYASGEVHDYVLWHQGRSYDPQTILGVALRHARGSAVSSDWSSDDGSRTAQALRDLGFDVVDPDGTPLADESAVGPWRDIAEVGTDEARQAWAEAARPVLLIIAGRYQAVISSKELAAEVQYRTGIRTKQLMHYWIGDVLARVATDCAARDEPLLSALCVNSTGSVGEAYGVAVAATYGEAPDDADDHAALERLKCYRHFEAKDLPADGGFASLTPKLAASRTRLRNARAAERPRATCPNCFMQLPATGICDACG